MIPIIKRVFALLFILLLAGCATGRNLKVDSNGPVCDALVGPILYTSTKKDSRRFAGVDLAAELAKRNRVGTNLKCPQYR